MIEQIKNNIKSLVTEHLSIDGALIAVETAKKPDADLAVPLFGLAKLRQESPQLVFDVLAPIIKSLDIISDVFLTGGFLNIKINRKAFSQHVLNEVFIEKNNYGNQESNKKTVVIDYSSPNIAKSFSVGHLRSTVIGNALKQLYVKAGYEVVGINHLGDWGTQFGRMIVAYQKWGNREAVEQNPIDELQRLYIRFHEELENDPSLDEKGKLAFLELEQNNQEYLKLWQWFRDESLKEFMNMYDLLGVSFDSYHGEAFYNDKMDAVVKELEDKSLLKEDQGAMVVALEENMPPALIKRTDGATLYITRDLAALLYRFNTYHFSKILYVVGNEQKLHFDQLKKVTSLMGYDFDLEHINFGLVLLDGKKMSTRGGNTKKLIDVILEAIHLAEVAIAEKNPSLENKEMVAKAVGLGAIIYNDLKNERHLDVDFNLSNMLKFEGQTGPYLQYSVVRIHSILKQSTYDQENIDLSLFEEDGYFELVKYIDQFPETILKSIEKNAPSTIARYMMTLSQSFNSFYGKHKINVEDVKKKNTNLYLVDQVRIVLEEGLRLLGMQSLKEM